MSNQEPPNMKLERFSRCISDSFCPSCLGAIAPVLLAHEGITKVTMAPTRNQIVVEYDPDRISREMLKNLLESAMTENTESSGVPGSAVDPVCGMSVKTDTSTLYSDHNGQRYYFCTSSCKHAFEQDPTLFEDVVLTE